jgi:hypothetical protein
MAKVITDMETWLHDFDDRIYRYVVYRKMFTPYEQEKRNKDETPFESVYYRFGKIEEVVNIGEGKWMIGFRNVINHNLSDKIEYYMLDEIRIELWERDQKMIRDVDGDEPEELQEPYKWEGFPDIKM